MLGINIPMENVDIQAPYEEQYKEQINLLAEKSMLQMQLLWVEVLEYQVQRDITIMKEIRFLWSSSAALKSNMVFEICLMGTIIYIQRLKNNGAFTVNILNSCTRRIQGSLTLTFMKF